MHSKSVNIEIMINDKADEVIDKLFESFLNRYQIGLETSVRRRDFIFDCFHLLYYKCHKINIKQGGSYTDPSDWIKNKKATINSINKKDNKCVVTVVLNHRKIKKDPLTITNIKPFKWQQLDSSP